MSCLGTVTYELSCVQVILRMSCPETLCSSGSSLWYFLFTPDIIHKKYINMSFKSSRAHVLNFDFDFKYKDLLLLMVKLYIPRNF